ncbi:MAG TPA: glucosamine-6-phosphate deaminase [Thermoanaerobaculia bacterium]|jgi:glucosamine-6-phosphate deaminase|nr:glucosamine-6-phosphate deaminase [Thermoanaerobaculia bacterium]
MNWETFDDADALSARAAEILLTAIRDNPRIVLGLPTGRTPIGMYDRVVRVCSREYHCFRDVTTFNLDEYAGVPADHTGSYFTYMKRHLFDAVDLDPTHAHLPNGVAPDLDAECTRYETEIREAGGLDLTFLGLGRNGHIGFNEPGTPFGARTRVVELTQSTRKANADLFPEGHVPTHAITMGIGTILESKRIVLLVAGSGKEEALARLRGGEISEAFPASALWKHDDVTVLTT